MNRDALLEKRAQLVAACEEHATVATPDAVRAFDLAEEEIRGIDAQLEGMAVRGRLDAIKAKNSQVVARPENRGGGNDAELARFFATRGREGSGTLEMRTLLTAATAATAGNTVPPTIMTGEFVKWLTWEDPVRKLATVQTVPNNLRLPVIDSRTTVSATAESAQGTLAPYAESNFTTIVKTFSAFKATAFTPVTEELLFDSSIDVASEIVADHARAHGRYRAAKHVTGAGTTEEQGLCYDDTSWAVTTKTGAVTTDVNFDHVIEAFTKMPTAYSQNGSWLMNQGTWASLLKIKAAATGNYLYDGMQGMMLQDGAAGLLMGRPVYIAQDMLTFINNSARNLIWFGDLARAYRIVDRKDITFTVDPYSQSVNGITRFLSSMRSDAQIVDKYAGTVIINKA